MYTDARDRPKQMLILQIPRSGTTDSFLWRPWCNFAVDVNITFRQAPSDEVFEKFTDLRDVPIS